MPDPQHLLSLIRTLVEAAADYDTAMAEWVRVLNEEKAGRSVLISESEAVNATVQVTLTDLEEACRAVGMAPPRSHPGPMCLFVRAYVAPLLAIAEAAQTLHDDANDVLAAFRHWPTAKALWDALASLTGAPE